MFVRFASVLTNGFLEYCVNKKRGYTIANINTLCDSVQDAYSILTIYTQLFLHYFIKTSFKVFIIVAYDFF